MTAWRTALRLALAGGATAAAYLGARATLGRPASPATLAALVLAALALTAGWSALRRLQALRGVFGAQDQEAAVLRTLERELSRSLRHDAPLVVAALHGRRGLRWRDVQAQLRDSDIVLRGHRGRLIIVMTETRIGPARAVLERMAQQLPIRAVALVDERAVRPGIALAGADARFRAHRQPMQAPTLALLRALRLGLFRAEARARPDAPAAIYRLDAASVVAANDSANQSALDDLTRRVA